MPADEVKGFKNHKVSSDFRCRLIVISGMATTRTNRINLRRSKVKKFNVETPYSLNLPKDSHLSTNLLEKMEETEQSVVLNIFGGIPVFEKMRRPSAKNVIAVILFGAIILVFALFGVTPRDSGTMQGGAAAVVNKSVISLADFRQGVEQAENQYRMQLDAIPQAKRQEVQRDLSRKVLEDLIAYEVIYQTAADMGIKVSDVEIRDQIMAIPAFQEDGKFRRERYDQYLNATRMKPKDFEDKIRKQALVSRVQKSFTSALEPVAGEAQTEKLIRETKYNIRFAGFNKALLEQSWTPSAAEVAQFLAAPGNLEKVKEQYGSSKSLYAQPEQVRARHILIKFEPGKKDSEEAALKKIQSIAKEEQGQDFGALAKKYSEDTASQKQGGDLNFFGRDRMTPAFEKAAFALPVGQVSDPVKTEFGYHLIKVEARKEASQRSFEEAKNDVAKKMMAGQVLNSKIDELKAALKAGKKAEVDAWVKNFNLKWEDTGDVSVGQPYWPKLGEADVALDAIFKTGTTSGYVPQLGHSGDQYLILDVRSFSQPKLSAEVSDMDKTALQFAAMRRANAVFDGWIENAIKQAKIQRNAALISK